MTILIFEMVVSAELVGNNPELAAIEKEVEAAAVVASEELAKLSDEHHLDAIEEQIAAEGLLGVSDAGASDVGGNVDSGVESFSLVTDEDACGLNFLDPFSEQSCGDGVPGYDRSLQVSSALNSLQSPSIRHFWENDFWGGFLSADSLLLPGTFNFNRPGLVKPLAEVMHSSQASHSIIDEPRVVSGFLECVKSVQIMSWKEEREAIHEKAVRRWIAMLEVWSPTVKIVECLNIEENFKCRAQILVDIFYNKAPATLMKRCRSLCRMTNYFIDRGMTYPCNESQCYMYFTVERSNGAPPSRLKGCFEAMVFARHVLGVTEFQEIIESRRCVGACGGDHTRILNQAEPLTVSQLRKLHAILNNDDQMWNRMFAGMCLFCVYGRSRWSDAQHGESVLFDEDEEGEVRFVEVRTACHKTARALALRHMFLPLVSPSTGVTTDNWGATWRQIRRELGVDEIKEYPLLPAPDKDLMPTKRPLSTEEAGAWLRYLLGVESFKKSGMKVSSHSLKATCLSYLAKRGCNHSDRMILGYHVGGAKMTLTYSRDSVSRPLLVLETMLEEIRTNQYNPNATRSGRILKRTAADAFGYSADLLPSLHPEETAGGSMAETKEEGTDQKEEREDDVISHVTTDSSSDSEPETSVKPIGAMRTFTIPDSTSLWVHKKLRTRHLSFKGYEKTLVCGRTISDMYELTGAIGEFDAPRCRQCFSSKSL